MFIMSKEKVWRQRILSDNGNFMEFFIQIVYKTVLKITKKSVVLIISEIIV